MTFDFKRFTIHQDQCAMKVGTDGVLLGAWASLAPTTRSLLDIGTGTGLIALMLAQRLEAAVPTSSSPAASPRPGGPSPAASPRPGKSSPPASKASPDEALIYAARATGSHPTLLALEIDPLAAAQAADNVAASPWPDQIHVLPRSLAAAAPLLADARFDLIVSNPPFYNATLKPDDEGRARARHKDSLPVADIAAFAQQHLTPDGRLALIYPTEYDAEVMTAAVFHGLHPVRLCDVLTKAGKPAKRRMAEFSPTAAPLLRETLAIRDADGLYTEAYRSLTAGFYLHLKD